MGLYKTYKYFSHIIEGEDGKLSGKRILGTLLILCGIHIGWYAVLHCMDKLDSIVMLVSSFFAGGLAFWGITTWASMKQGNNPSPFPPNPQPPADLKIPSKNDE